MISGYVVTLARTGDAQAIARLSRDCIEVGLAWRWRAPRVLRNIADASTNVVVSRDTQGMAGFAMMKYGEQEAHVLLLAVCPDKRRCGVGSGLMAWLEATARTAGLGVIRLEARLGNAPARAFYRRLGYREMNRVPGLYDGIEDGIRIARDLWE